MSLKMTFSEKLETQFSNFSLKTPGHGRAIHHLYADYVELLALLSSDNFITPTDAINRFFSDSDKIKKKLDYSDEIGSNKAELDEEDERWIKEIFLVLKERTNIFKNVYPFEYNKRKIRLKNNLCNFQKIYLMLLLSSNLEQFSTMSHTLTSEFEILSFHVLKNYLPKRAETKQFGKNSDYSGNAVSKIKDLAKDLNLEIIEREISNINKKNSQERGLDIVGWIPFNDKNSNMIVILGQCACGKNWYAKKNDTSRYEKYFFFNSLKPIHSLFIPYALLKESNDFYQSDEIGQHLIFERTRILDYTENDIFFNKLDSKKFVERCIEYEEDIV